LFVVQAEGGEEACLRPDFTVPVARLHLDRGAASGRYLYEGRVFRASADDDRDEEMLQIGLERYDLGGPAPAADAEIVALAWRAVAAGGRQDLTLWLGDIALFAAFVDALDLAPAVAARLKRAAARPRLLQAELARAGQVKDETGMAGGLADILAGLAPRDAGRMLEEVWALAGIEPVGGRGPTEIAERLIRRAEAARAPALTTAQAEAIGRFLTIEAAPSDALAAVAALAGPRAKALKTALADWTTRLSALSHAGVPVSHARFATALGHAFDYYDGLTFEIRSDALGADRPVAVGGRYDGLPGRLGGPAQARAVGCMVRPRRAVLNLQERQG
jgi:ATP phosphoribosyltransferase regulatory subunit